MLNFILVSFCTAYIIVTFRVTVMIRVSFRFRVRVELYFGTGNLNYIQ